MEVFNRRVLILAPVGRDAETANAVLREHGMECLLCSSPDELAERVDLSIGAVLLTEEALARADLSALGRKLDAQPSWSDIPFVMLMQRGRSAAPRSQRLSRILPRRLTHIVYLERPVGILSLVSAIDSALTARQRQFQIRDELRAAAVANANLRQSEERLQFALSAGRLGSWELLLNDGTIQASAATKRLFGQDPESPITGATLSALVHPNDLARVFEAFQRSMQARTDYDIECRIVTSDQSIKWIAVRGTVTIDERSNAVVGMTGVVQDVTVRKEAEAALALSHDELENLVRVRTHELGESNRRLLLEAAERQRAEEALLQAQKMEAVGRLTGGIAHDFNNLLMALVGNLELASRHLQPDHDAHRFIQNAKRATERGTRLSSQLLAFSRIQKLTLQSVAIDQVLRDSLDLARHSLGPLYSLETDFGSATACATADPNQLELAVLNLVTNARDAMPTGGAVHISTCVTDIDATDGDLSAGRYVQVDVRDEGIGMSQELLARVFEPFFTTKPVGKGTGLGLAQVYGITRQCGGAVRVCTAPGAGTTFTLLFPFVAYAGDPASSVVVHPGAPVETQALGRSVLVIDDDDNVRESFVAALSLEGFSVDEARSGAEGLEKLAAHKPDVLIVDYAMPGMNGADVAQQAQRLLPGLPVIMVSGYSDSAALDRIANATIIRKPFSLTHLTEALSSALNRPTD